MPLPGLATVELTCIMLPDEPEPEEVERTEWTRSMWHRAKKIADRFGAHTNFSEHQDYREACLYGDAYVYVSTRDLERMLDAFDRTDVAYDNIDLPSDVTRALVTRLKKRYPPRSGVMVNL